MGFVRKKTRENMDLFRGYINSTLEQLIKKEKCTHKQYHNRKMKERREREKRTEKNNKVNVPYTLSLFFLIFYFLIPVPFSIYAICVYSFLY